jgi:hypothetical protein
MLSDGSTGPGYVSLLLFNEKSQNGKNSTTTIAREKIIIGVLRN